MKDDRPAVERGRAQEVAERLGEVMLRVDSLKRRGESVPADLARDAERLRCELRHRVASGGRPD